MAINIWLLEAIFPGKILLTDIWIIEQTKRQEGRKPQWEKQGREILSTMFVIVEYMLLHV